MSAAPLVVVFLAATVFFLARGAALLVFLAAGFLAAGFFAVAPFLAAAPFFAGAFGFLALADRLLELGFRWDAIGAVLPFWRSVHALGDAELDAERGGCVEAHHLADAGQH